MYKISNEEFDEAYAIIEQSFPISEMRTYDDMKRFYKSGKFKFYGIKEDMLLGVIMCWECETCVFIENFAIVKEARGKGIGSVMLQQVKEQYPHQLIILEVEKPFDDMSERRIGFYNRNQFILNIYGYDQPQINTECNKIPLLLMSYPTRLQKSTFQTIKADLFANVYHVLEKK